VLNIKNSFFKLLLFEHTVVPFETIAYLKRSNTVIVIIFHLNQKHYYQFDLALYKVNCDEMELLVRTHPSVTYRSNQKLDYPINVARNVARETAYTHYVFPADIELYPNPGTCFYQS
jgi:hypothetical protein